MFRFYIALSLVILISLPLRAELSHRPFQWADDENFKPLIYRNTAGKSEGLFYDLLTEAFKRMHTPLQNRLYPWSRAQKIVKDGEADGMVTVYTKARQKFFVATDPVLVVEERVFTSRENPKLQQILQVRSITDLKKFVLVDTADAGWSKEHLKNMHIIWLPNLLSALNMLASNRADIYLMNNFTGPYFTKKQIKKRGPLCKKLKNIVMGNYPVATMKYCLLIQKNSPYVSIIARFNEALQQMHKDGTYKRILKRYEIDMAYHQTKDSNLHEKNL